MSVKLRKYQRFFHFSIAPFWSLCHPCSWQGAEPKDAVCDAQCTICRRLTLTKRNTTMAMKKKKKKAKAEKKS
jgi:hypothetical protein